MLPMDPTSPTDQTSPADQTSLIDFRLRLTDTDYRLWIDSRAQTTQNDFMSPRSEEEKPLLLFRSWTVTVRVRRRVDAGTLSFSTAMLLLYYCDLVDVVPNDTETN